MQRHHAGGRQARVGQQRVDILRVDAEKQAALVELSEKVMRLSGLRGADSEDGVQDAVERVRVLGEVVAMPGILRVRAWRQPFPQLIKHAAGAAEVGNARGRGGADAGSEEHEDAAGTARGQQ